MESTVQLQELSAKVNLLNACIHLISISLATDVSITGDECTSGEARLYPYTDGLSSREGRLEICLNKAWGTVCNTMFDILDAEVACSQVAGFSGQGLYS